MRREGLWRWRYSISIATLIAMTSCNGCLWSRSEAIEDRDRDDVEEPGAAREEEIEGRLGNEAIDYLPRVENEVAEEGEYPYEREPFEASGSSKIILNSDVTSDMISYLESRSSRRRNAIEVQSIDTASCDRSDNTSVTALTSTTQNSINHKKLALATDLSIQPHTASNQVQQPPPLKRSKSRPDLLKEKVSSLVPKSSTKRRYSVDTKSNMTSIGTDLDTKQDTSNNNSTIAQANKAKPYRNKNTSQTSAQSKRPYRKRAYTTDQNLDHKTHFTKVQQLSNIELMHEENEMQQAMINLQKQSLQYRSTPNANRQTFLLANNYPVQNNSQPQASYSSNMNPHRYRARTHYDTNALPLSFTHASCSKQGPLAYKNSRESIILMKKELRLLQQADNDNQGLNSDRYGLQNTHNMLEKSWDTRSNDQESESEDGSYYINNSKSSTLASDSSERSGNKKNDASLSK